MSKTKNLFSVKFPDMSLIGKTSKLEAVDTMPPSNPGNQKQSGLSKNIERCGSTNLFLNSQTSKLKKKASKVANTRTVKFLNTQRSYKNTNQVSGKVKSIDEVELEE